MAALTDDELEARIKALESRDGEGKKPRKVNGGVPDGAPLVTKGSIGEDSRPFSLCKALWACRTGNWEHAKPERDVINDCGLEAGVDPVSYLHRNRRNHQAHVDGGRTKIPI